MGRNESSFLEVIFRLGEIYPFHFFFVKITQFIFQHYRLKPTLFEMLSKS